MRTTKLIVVMLAAAGITILSSTSQNRNHMGNGKKILVIGRHADMLAKVTAMLNANGYTAIGKQWNEEAIAAFKADTFNAVVIGGGVDAESRIYFHEEFPKLKPSVKIINAHPQTVLEDLRRTFLNKQK